MTDFDRNVRTLLVCFVVALSVLVPLRIVKGDSVLIVREAEVLGESEEVVGDQMELIYGDEIVEENVDEVVLPDAEVPMVKETEE
ncbi:MAG: hypothetical protein KIH89_004185 [Candidatus Shapirobacteria bacterium]|nr:hypothetical protein [Candidatus Shapirobacteria bacterium]